MRHNMSIVMALLKEPNDTVFQKTLAFSDYYFGADDWEYPLGLIQMCAKSHGEQIRGETLPGYLSWLPEMPFEKMAEHSIDFWLQSEDLPRPENRIRYDGDRVVLDIREGNEEAAKRLRAKLKGLLTPLGAWPHLIERRLYLGKDIPIGGTAHQAGTCRFGTDPASSVLDLDCKAHELDNLYIADASFFPSIGAVNPTLTIIANALRVADRIKERLSSMKCSRAALILPAAALLLTVGMPRRRRVPGRAHPADQPRGIGPGPCRGVLPGRAGVPCRGARTLRQATLAALGLADIGAEEVVMRLGAQDIALVRFAAQGRPYPRDSRSDDLWFQHLAIVVSDMDVAYAHLSRMPDGAPSARAARNCCRRRMAPCGHSSSAIRMATHWS